MRRLYYFTISVKTLNTLMRLMKRFGKLQIIYPYQCILRIWSHLLEKSVIGNFIFCVVLRPRFFKLLFPF